MNYICGIEERQDELEAGLQSLRQNVMGDIQLVPGKRYSALAGRKEVVGIARQTDDGDMVSLEVQRDNGSVWFVKPDLLADVRELPEQQEVKATQKPKLTLKRESFIIKTDKLKMTHGRNNVVVRRGD